MSLRTLIETARTQLPTPNAECAESASTSPVPATATVAAGAALTNAAPAPSHDHVAQTTSGESAAQRLFGAAQAIAGASDTAWGVDASTHSVFVSARRTSFGDADNGVEVQVREARIGAQTSLTNATLRADATLSDAVSAHAEVFSASANVGVYNADGSVGLNAGAGVNVASADVTYDASGFRLSAGLSEGFGAGGSFGVRDADGDGRRESCGSISAGPINVGSCYEPYTVAETVFRLATAPARYTLGALNAAL